MFLVYIIFVIKWLVTTVEVCPSECKCRPSMNRVICQYVNLAAFPQGIPTTTTELYIQHTNLRMISREDVKGLKWLKALHLNGNLLENMGREVLCEMPRLLI